MSTNWHAILWRGLSDEARTVARDVGNTELKLQTVLLAARYIAMAVRAERASENEHSDKAR